MTYRVDVATSGPFFDGRADRAVDEYATDVRSDLATRALVYVMATLASPHPIGIRKRTPFYETRLNIAGDARTDDSLVVNDDKVIYGAWLEGIGSRNYPVTRFRGYAAFRKSFHRVERDVPEVLRMHLGHHLRKMN